MDRDTQPIFERITLYLEFTRVAAAHLPGYNHDKLFDALRGGFFKIPDHGERLFFGFDGDFSNDQSEFETSLGLLKPEDFSGDTTHFAEEVVIVAKSCEWWLGP